MSLTTDKLNDHSVLILWYLCSFPSKRLLSTLNLQTLHIRVGTQIKQIVLNKKEFIS